MYQCRLEESHHFFAFKANAKRFFKRLPYRRQRRGVVHDPDPRQRIAANIILMSIVTRNGLFC